jgi:ATP-dependent DNA helicase RecG
MPGNFHADINSDKIISFTSGIKYADKILELIQDNPKITATEISEVLSVPKRTLDRNISKLVERKIIERQGSTKSGNWIIIKIAK